MSAPTELGVPRVALATSTDGIRWTPVMAAIPDSQEGRIAATDSTIAVVQGLGTRYDCAVGSDGFEHCSFRPLRAWRSSDGSTWQEAPKLPSSADAWAYDMAASPAGFVVVGSVHSRPAMWFSPDGSSWEMLGLTDPTFDGATLDRVAAVHGGFVAAGSIGRAVPDWCGLGCYVGGQAAAWWSPDGRNWTKADVSLPAGGALQMDRVYSARGGLLALGSLASGGDNTAADRWAAWTSTDGRSWAYVAIDTTDDDGRPSFKPSAPIQTSGLVTGDGDRILSFTRSSAASRDSFEPLAEIWESFDGVSWHRLRVEGYEGALARLGDVAWMVRLSVEPDGLIASWPDDETVTVMRAVALP